jgi:hypothetical protein
MIALEPPGNVARDLALYRRELFARLGEGSALAFPEIVPLAFASDAGRLSALALADCWKGIEGSFRATEPQISRGILYLAMEGPLSALSSRAFEASLAMGKHFSIESPLETGIGIFLCRPADPSLALAEAARIGPPRAGFRDCSLILLGLRLGAEPFAAATWRVLARAKRRTGLI